jgi:hypothetical protein
MPRIELRFHGSNPGRFFLEATLAECTARVAIHFYDNGTVTEACDESVLSSPLASIEVTT